MSTKTHISPMTLDEKFLGMVVRPISINTVPVDTGRSALYRYSTSPDTEKEVRVKTPSAEGFRFRKRAHHHEIPRKASFIASLRQLATYLR